MDYSDNSRHMCGKGYIQIVFHSHYLFAKIFTVLTFLTKRTWGSFIYQKYRVTLWELLTDRLIEETWGHLNFSQ